MKRRAFAESLAVAALAPMLGVPAEALRLDPVGPSEARPPEMPDGASASGSRALPLALALTEIVRLRYGSRLRVEDLTAITRQIEAGLERADLVREAELSNVAPLGATPQHGG
ncbi:MAG: hypothetical protein M3Q93_13285 [Gemmatimonadota bacterium]|nr:hypothetical protein [Gemmatimonadota bacterium]